MRKEPHKIPWCLVEMPHLNLVFVEERPDFTHAIAENKRANSHNFKIKKLK